MMTRMVNKLEVCTLLTLNACNHRDDIFDDLG